MNRQEHLLTIAMEECAEVAHRLAKVLRFGWGQVQPGLDTHGAPYDPNTERVMTEFHDLVAVMELAGFHPRSLDDGLIRRKKARVEEHLAESRQLGTMTTPPTFICRYTVDEDGTPFCGTHPRQITSCSGAFCDQCGGALVRA